MVSMRGNITVDACPVCGGFMKMENQVIEMNHRRKPGFFSGLGHCFNCGRMRVSGTIENEIPRILAFTPVCECCLSDVPVIKVDSDEDRWICLACLKSIEVNGNRLFKTRARRSVRPALAVV